MSTEDFYHLSTYPGGCEYSPVTSKYAARSTEPCRLLATQCTVHVSLSVAPSSMRRDSPLSLTRHRDVSFEPAQTATKCDLGQTQFLFDPDNPVRRQFKLQRVFHVGPSLCVLVCSAVWLRTACMLSLEKRTRPVHTNKRMRTDAHR